MLAVEVRGTLWAGRIMPAWCLESSRLTADDRAAIICQMDKSEALISVRELQTSLIRLSEARDKAILDAIRAGAALREIADVADISHEAVRRVARALSVWFTLNDHEYAITHHQADVFIYKLAGFNEGKFPGDVELINAPLEWLAPAGDLARAIERSKNGDSSDPIPLDGDAYHQMWGYALRQVLRLSYMERPGDVARLYDALTQRYA